MNAGLIKGMGRGVPAFLASVTSVDEARLAITAGADIIDCKDPSRGALGALDAGIVRTIVKVVAGRVPVSATIGDLPADAQIMCEAAVAVAATGVDIVKAGFFGETAPQAAIAALGAADIGRARMFAVLMADRQPDFAVISAFAKAGFLGVMLDTADKTSGSLSDVLDSHTLASFLRTARKNGLAAGLAGSLKRDHIAALARLQPDILGFRGALCTSGRTGALDAARTAAVRDAIDAAAHAGSLSERTVA
jgi:(5-formylfuran-3-yl)methyl phosphate synthase